MEYLYFDSLDSTSTKAQEMLKERRTFEKNQPLVVQAGRQTGGRGRRGHGWQSPAGNLYTTLVIPQPFPREGQAHTDPESSEACRSQGQSQSQSQSIALTPLKVAVLVARWVEASFGIRITLKWPNDLFLFGGKLGGILVEAAVSRDGDSLSWGPLVIGIGLNLNVVPREHDGAVCLATYTGQREDPKTRGLSLAEAILGGWGGLPLCQVTKEGASWSLSQGHPWISQNTGEEGAEEWGGLCLLDHQGPEGTLRLKKQSPAVPPSVALGDKPESASGEIVELASSHHQMRWAYTRADQKKASSARAPLIVADVGNSRLKIGFFADYQDPQPSWVTSYASPGGVDREALKAQFSSGGGVPHGWPIHILSVNPQSSALFAEALVALGLSPVMVKKRPSLLHPHPLVPYPFGELGIDRIAAMEGFLASLTPEQRAADNLAVVIAVGTATTIDIVSTRGQHQGGVILPGIGLSLTTLHRETGLLPLAPSEVASLALGTSTESALSQGVIGMTVGAVGVFLEKGSRSRKSVHKTAGLEPSQVVITGGMGPSLAPHLPGSFVSPNLILSGGRYLVLAGG